MLAFGYIYWCFLECLTAQHILFPWLGAVRFLQRDNNGLLVIELNLKAQITFIVGVCGNHGGIEHGISLVDTLELIDESVVLGDVDSVHRVAEHLDGCAFTLLVVAGILRDEAVHGGMLWQLGAYLTEYGQIARC